MRELWRSKHRQGADFAQIGAAHPPLVRSNLSPPRRIEFAGEKCLKLLGNIPPRDVKFEEEIGPVKVRTNPRFEFASLEQPFVSCLAGLGKSRNSALQLRHCHLETAEILSLTGRKPSGLGPGIEDEIALRILAVECGEHRVCFESKIHCVEDHVREDPEAVVVPSEESAPLDCIGEHRLGQSSIIPMDTGPTVVSKKIMQRSCGRFVVANYEYER